MSFYRVRSWVQTVKEALALPPWADSSKGYACPWTTADLETLLFGTGDTDAADRERAGHIFGRDNGLHDGASTLDDPSRPSQPSLGARRLALRLERTTRHAEGFVAFSGLSKEDGSSLVVSQTALALAQMRIGRVVLVDGDLRSPRLQALHAIPDTPGLLDFLRGRATIEHVLYTLYRERLSILPAAEAASDEEIMLLLTGAKMKELMSILRHEFRFVLFDSPPINGCADAIVLASLVRRVVMVAGRGRRSRTELLQARRALSEAEADVLGVILS